eukprot:XP_001704141.1 Hypothetical protein GL50803_31930 [Giardia lamblia ATCC 50803]
MATMMPTTRMTRTTREKRKRRTKTRMMMIQRMAQRGQSDAVVVAACAEKTIVLRMKSERRRTPIVTLRDLAETFISKALLRPFAGPR